MTNETPETPRKRRPGAPKGNKNAMKHGRYSAERRALFRRVRALTTQVRAMERAGARYNRARTEAERDEALAEIAAAARAARDGIAAPDGRPAPRNGDTAPDRGPAPRSGDAAPDRGPAPRSDDTAPDRGPAPRSGEAAKGGGG